MINKSFEGYLKNQRPQVVDNTDVRSVYTIVYEDDGSSQHFLDTWQERGYGTNIKQLFDTPTSWNKIVIDGCDCLIDMVFDAMSVEGKINNITVQRKQKKDYYIYTYLINFSKMFDKDDQVIVDTYLMKKEEDEETGKKVLVKFNIEFKEKVIDKKDMNEIKKDEFDEI